MEKKFFFKIAYDGSRYRGWQLQAPDQENIRPSISRELKNAIEKVCLHSNFILHGSGRTDVGVHARAQTAHLKLETRLLSPILERAINSFLPEDIRVYSMEETPDEFHAQHSVKRKCYRYFILSKKNPRSPDWPFLAKWAWFVPYELNSHEMHKAIQFLVGTHDFAAFRNIGTPVKHTVRQIFQADVLDYNEKEFCDFPWMPPKELGFHLLEIRIIGKGFLKQMVRNITGTLMEVGRGNLSPNSMKEILEAGDRSKAGATAPSQGLFLDFVEYED